MSLSSSLHELKILVLSLHPLVALETLEEERARSLVASAARDLGLPFFEWSMTQGLHCGRDGETGGHPIATTVDPDGALRHLRALEREGLYLLKDFAPHLEQPGTARLLRETCQAFTRTGSTIVLCGAEIALPADLEQHAAYVRLRLPDAGELRAATRAVLESVQHRASIKLDFDPGGFEALIDALRGMTLNQARQAIAYAVLEDGRLSVDDVARIVDRKAKWIQDSGLLEYFPAGDNDFELGGFEALRAWLERARQGFTPEAAALNLSAPRGVLLVGVQGCGKSLAAKAIARTWRQPLLKLDAGRLYDKFIGESERNLRRALELAEAMEPAVLWIDEVEKALASSRDDAQDGGLSRRLQGYLLTWLQEREARVFVVATANDVFSLPPEFMRKGRFDETFFVDLPHPGERHAIFEIHLRRRRQDPARFQLDDLVLASEGMTGAEIEQAVIASLYRALHEKHPLDDALLLRELDAIVPLSLSRREDVERLRALARERFAPASRPDRARSR